MNETGSNADIAKPADILREGAISNLQNDDRQCSPQHHFALQRSSDDLRNATYLGSCGVAPTAFGALPATYDYRRFVIPELQ